MAAGIGEFFFKRQTKQNNGELKNFFGGKFKAGCKHTVFANKLIEKHSNKHGDNSRAYQMYRQKTFEPHRQQSNQCRQNNSRKILNGLHK